MQSPQNSKAQGSESHIGRNCIVTSALTHIRVGVLSQSTLNSRVSSEYCRQAELSDRHTCGGQQSCSYSA